MKAKTWLVGWMVLVVFALFVIGGWVYKIDPYFHYHKPDLETYFYTLDNQRSQNDGITKHFDYNALITGTSMTENFKTSDMDEIFGVNSIKVSYSGGSYKEINDNLIVALENNPNLKTIVRCLDYVMLLDDKDRMREDLGTYPTYLYDENPFNDVKYLFNKDVIFTRAYAMTLANDDDNFVPGITSFDDYSSWQHRYTFGKNTVIPDGVVGIAYNQKNHLSDTEREMIKENITQNVTLLADKYPDVDFYYFFSPYSVAWWEIIAISNANFYKWIEAEKYAIELILEHENIHLYSFNNCTGITTDLNNYKDTIHYGEWVNSLILRWMYEGEYLLTKDNYLNYLEEELAFYRDYNYLELNSQEDYENDFYAAALLNGEIWDVEPIDILEDDNIKIEYNNENVGCKIEIDEIGKHNYLVFYGKKVSDHGQPSVFVYNQDNEKIAEIVYEYQDIDNEWHQYVIDLSKAQGKITIEFNGGYIDNTGSADSAYIFSDIKLY